MVDFFQPPAFFPMTLDLSQDGPWLGLFNLSVRSSSLDTLLKTQQVSGLSSLASPHQGGRRMELGRT